MRAILASDGATLRQALVVLRCRAGGFSAGLESRLVARGAADVMIEPALRVWDWAPIAVIVEEAGGRVTTFEDDPPSDGSSVLTSNAVLHEDVVRRLAP